MLTGETIKLLNTKGIVAYIGSRNDQLIPSLAPTYGVKLNENNSELTIFLEKSAGQIHMDNLKSNGKITIVIANPVNHYTNQFKGEFVLEGDCSEEETEFAKNSLDNFKNVLCEGYGENIRENLSGVMVNQAFKLTMKIEQVYDQTPGPGAGKLISEQL